MDLPHRTIRFTTTDDGVEIAYWAIGDGRPIVILNNFGLSHAELEWEVESLATFYTALAEHYLVVRFDPRGAGLSGEPPGGWGAATESGAQVGLSLDGMGRDISAVVQALGLDSYALLAVNVQGPVGIAHAATHPEVSELILCETTSSIPAGPIGVVLRQQVGLESLAVDTGTQPFDVWERVGPTNEVKDLTKLTRALTQTGLIPISQLEWDADTYLPDVSIPTLVLTSRSASLADFHPSARQLSSSIADARLVTLGGDDRSFAPYWTERSETLRAIHAFLNTDVSSDIGSATTFRTVVFTDIVGSTQFLNQAGDEAGRAAMRDVEKTVKLRAVEHGGELIKDLGDGSLISFASNTAAIRFALSAQEAVETGPLPLRIGMAAGEPIYEDDDIYGAVVAQASRIADLGNAGEVVVSDSVRQLATGKGFKFEQRGETSLKGFDEAVRVWTVLGS